MANGDISKLGLRGASVNARFWCSARTQFAGAPFFSVITEKTDKSQAVGGRRIPPLCTKRKKHATRAAAPSP